MSHFCSDTAVLQVLIQRVNLPPRVVIVTPRMSNRRNLTLNTWQCWRQMNTTGKLMMWTIRCTYFVCRWEIFNKHKEFSRQWFDTLTRFYKEHSERIAYSDKFIANPISVSRFSSLHNSCMCWLCVFWLLSSVILAVWLDPLFTVCQVTVHLWHSWCV